MSGVRDCWILAGYLLVVLRRALTVLWIRLNKFLSNADGQVRPSSDFHHKVVIIGDGIAEGIGDWVIMGALAGVTRHIERRASDDANVRTKWSIINRGRAGTVTSEWLPSNEKSLYRRKVECAACRDAEIFVVIVGTMDVVRECVGMPVAAMRKAALDDYSEDELCETTRNIRAICEDLRSSGKKVILCNVLTDGAGISQRAGVAKRLNRQLMLYARATATSKDTGKEAVQLVKLNEPRTTRNGSRAFDGLHLNSEGYRSFSKTLYDTLGPMMVAVEWKVWRQRIGGGAGNGSVPAPVSGQAGEGETTTWARAKSARSKKAD